MRRYAIFMALVLGWCATAGASSSAREAGFVLLREGVGARASAMGEAYTAVTGDQTAAFWNPAGVAALKGKDFVLSHHHSFQGINQAYGGWAYGNDHRGLALSLGVYGVGGLEARTGPSLEPLGTFGMDDFNAGLSYAQRIGSRLYAGFSVRALYEEIGPESAWGGSVDFGALYRLPNGLMLGASYRNLGRMERLDQARTPLPRTFRVGASYGYGDWTGAVDLRVPEAGTKGVNMGVEYAVKGRLFLRGGYETGQDTRSWALGLGLVRKNWRVDYAFVPASMGLGGSHRISLGIR